MTPHISSIAYYLPSKKLTNQEIAIDHPQWTIEKIASKTGIQCRSIADEDEFCSDMAVSASKILFEQNNIDKSLIDFVLLCTQSPDYILPTTACLVQDQLQLNNTVGALDINLGCSGFIYGLSLAYGLIHSGQVKNVLLITSETYSKYINQHDKGNKTIFGDAASATLISSDKNSYQLSARIRNFAFGTDGSKYDSLIIKNSGVKGRNKVGCDVFSEDNNYIYNDDNLYMDGKEIFHFTSFQVPNLIKAVLEKNNLSLSDIDLFVFHQANDFMLQTVRKRIGIPEDKFYVYLKDIGNTVSSSIPIALKSAIDSGRIKQGMTVLLAGFGVGLSMSATIVDF